MDGAGKGIGELDLTFITFVVAGVEELILGVLK